jgi:hypothetical protein
MIFWRLDNREVLEILLRSIEFEVTSAINGKDGIYLDQRWLPDIVFNGFGNPNDKRN